KPTKSCAPRCPIRSARSGCGTATFPNPLTKKSRACSRGPKANTRSLRIDPARRAVPMKIWQSPSTDRERVGRELRPHLVELSGNSHDHDALLQLVGKARFALLGEASHGTEEFYRERIRITQRLIEEKGFTAVAVEADWPDAWRVNRYVRDASDDFDAEEALSDFRRFPRWMWQIGRASCRERV